MDELLNFVKNNIDSTNKAEIRQIDGSIVKTAVDKLRFRKTDVTGSYVSDALKHAPDILFNQLAEVFRSWLYRGTVTKSLLACSFLPLLIRIL